MQEERREREEVYCSACGESGIRHSTCYYCGGYECSECIECYQCGFQTCQCECCPECGYHPCECDRCEECDSKSCICHLPASVGGGGSCVQVGVKRGLKPERNLKENVADYYLLHNLWTVQKYPLARQPLQALCDELAPEFATYLDMACGGELRHGYTTYHEKLEPAPVSGLSGKRGLAWERWADWKDVSFRARYAKEVFFWDSKWNPETNEWERMTTEVWSSGSYGGPKWGQIADTLLMYVEQKIDNIAFIDRVWNLQHNGGCALNKVYSVGGVDYVLNAHGKDDYNTMLQYASAGVRLMWQHSDRWKRRELALDEKMRLNALSLAEYNAAKREEPHRAGNTPDREPGRRYDFVLAEATVGILPEQERADVLTIALQKAEQEEREYVEQQAAENTIWYQAYGGRWVA